MSFLSKKRNKILLSILVVIITCRLILHYVLLSYINKALIEIEDYDGEVKDLDLSIIRGGFTLYDLKIIKEKSNIPVPFLTLKKLIYQFIGELY